MKNINCILCNLPSDKIVISENNFNGVKCDNCELIYISPRPNEEEMINFYHGESDFGDGTSPYLDAKVRYRVSKSKKIHASNTIKNLKKFKQKGSLIEIGPGPGLFMMEAKKNQFKTIGLEINPSRAHYLETLGFECITSPLEKIDLNNFSKADIVYHCDVMAHFYEPVKAINIMSNMLKEDGILMIETGNIPELSNFWISSFSSFHYPGHLFFFSEKSLSKLLKQNGFEILEVKRYPSIFNIFYEKIVKILKNLFNLKKQRNLRSSNKENKTFEKEIKFRASILDKTISKINSFKAFLQYKILHLIPFLKNTPSQIVIIAKKVS